MKVTRQILEQGVTEVVLQNTAGTEVTLWSWGATLAKLLTKDDEGVRDNIVLSLPLATCLRERHYLGVTVGPVAGRISKGQVKQRTGQMSLTLNEGSHHVHGGEKALDQQNWQLEETGQTETRCYVRFSYHQEHLTNGYPGNLSISVTYALTNENQLQITYEGSADQDTLLNPTNHSYFNLSGGKERTIANHYLQVRSDYYVPLDEENIPLGTKEPLTNSALDLKLPKKLTSILALDHPQIRLADGLNHGFELSTGEGPSVILYHPESGRRLGITTTEPAVVVYTGNHFEGGALVKHGGLAIETQRLPDCENHAGFGSIRLKKGDTYHSQTTLTFSALDR